MISDTQKEIWTMEAAVKVCHPDKPKDIAECVDFVTDGVKWLKDNPNAQKLAYNVIDVVISKMEIVINNLYNATDDKATIKKVAAEFNVQIDEKHS